MALNESEILRILEMFDRSGWNEMHLQSGAVKLLISKTGRMQSLTTQPAPASGAASAPMTAPIPAPVPAKPPAASAPPPIAASEPAADPRWIAVRAPMLGHFYAAPGPGAPPFVKPGQPVAAGDTVGILEVMKLMNHVKAGVAGTIARIVIQNGDLAEFEQVLLYIDPAG